ncbi:MAG: glycosyltransferase family 2 protein [Candidatus Omnitrophica bacterium]|nr:glycosyltransferase family 2 protein [Candidatus Omnitrophota bacterium]
MNMVIVIPAYNEAATIGTIVKSLKAKGFHILVIDDGSADDTGAIAARHGAEVLAHKKNKGKGASLRQAFRHICEKTRYDYVVVMDGDGQHKVDDVDRFVKEAREEADDIIIGNRMNAAQSMPHVRFYTNKIMSALLSFICKQNIPDTQCGFRLMKRSVIETIPLRTSDYDTESEILIKASRRGFKIGACPIETIYGGETSDIHPIKDTVRFIILIAKVYFSKHYRE